jgi:type IV pilus assembly protein PilA
MWNTHGMSCRRLRKKGGRAMGRQSGFTLIELMIVVAIIAILAAIAISQYQDYVIRAQVAEGASLATASKTAVTEYYNHIGAHASSNLSYGLPSATSISGKYVTQVDASNGLIVATFGKDANTAIQGATLTFSAMPQGNSMAWVCNPSQQMKNVWVPAVCRDN